MRQCRVSGLIKLELHSLIKSNKHYSVHGVYVPLEKEEIVFLTMKRFSFLGSLQLSLRHLKQLIVLHTISRRSSLQVG